MFTVADRRNNKQTGRQGINSKSSVWWPGIQKPSTTWLSNVRHVRNNSNQGVNHTNTTSRLRRNLGSKNPAKCTVVRIRQKWSA